MSKKQEKTNPLRKAAENRLSGISPSAEQIHPVEELLHELHVHQIELEMQNETLRQSQIELEKSRDRYVDFYDFSPVGYLTLKQDGSISEVNLTGAELLGMERSKLKGCRFASFVAKDERDQWQRYFLSLLKHNGKQHCELLIQRNDGSHRVVQLDCLRLKQTDGEEAVRVVLADISERKLAEVKVKESEAHYKTLFEQTSDYVLVLDLSDRGIPVIVDANEAALIKHGYSRAELIGKPISILDKSISDAEILRLVATDSVIHFETIHQRKDGVSFAVDVAMQRVYIGDKSLLYSVERDISERKRNEKQIAAYLQQLEESMRGTLQAVSNMVEQRDPYTAGHERRVGIIAEDIAREMGWPDDKSKDLQLIGLVHDIGKISIPAEILTKPRRLTPIEYEIVKLHVEHGYEILKDVKFPLPIAEIILQHHERMDGSGYPCHLQGEQILPEARILAVADVLESMSSHRPYRAALGTDAALKEIVDHRGTLFDDEVVDSLLRLMHEKGYQLPK